MPPPEAVDEDARERDARALLGVSLRGKWTLDSVLGMGGMSTVYAATHRNGHRVAIKVLRPELSLNPAARVRFVREAYAANRVARAGGVAVLDDGVDGKLVFLVMELLEGETLRQRLRVPSARLGLPEALRIADELLMIVAYAHACGIIHRDLKPENIFLLRDGHVRVLDFGLARIEKGEGASVTRSHATLGTPSFMSPEQARGRPDEIDARTDVWAVGATLFTCLAGRFVHLGETVNEVMIAAGTRPASPIATHAPEIPRAVAEVIDRALAFRREDRWQTAAEMRNALREAQGLPRAEISEPAPAPEKRSAAAYAPTVEDSSEAPRRVSLEEHGDIPAPPSAASIRRSLATTAPRRGRMGMGTAPIALVLLASGVGVLAIVTRSSPRAPTSTALDAHVEAPPAPAPNPAPPAPASESLFSAAASTPPPPRPEPALRPPLRRAAPVVRSSGGAPPESSAKLAPPPPTSTPSPPPSDDLFERRK